jgi:hypothetical protein
VAASTSEEMDSVDLDEEAAARRPSGEQLRTRSSGPAARRDPKDVAFDDVTPTRSLAEVGLADMDEDLPTRMQTLDEVARFRSAAAVEAAPVEAEPAEPAPVRRDVVRPPPSAPAPEAVAFRSFPVPRGRDSVPSMPPAPAVPKEAAFVGDDADEAQRAADDDLDLRSVPPDYGAAPAPSPDSQGTRILLAISFALFVLAASALLIERFAR